MSSLSRPQSSAAMRSPITHAAGFSSPLKYSSNSFNPDSTAIFASEERKFFSSGKGSSRDLDRDASGRNRSGSYSTSSSAASPEYRTYRVHSPPPIPERMQNPAYNGRSQQQQLGELLFPIQPSVGSFSPSYVLIYIKTPQPPRLVVHPRPYLDHIGIPSNNTKPLLQRGYTLPSHHFDPRRHPHPH